MQLRNTTVNHDRWHRDHTRRLATPGIAPGPPLPPRGRVNLTALVVALGFLAFVAAIVVALLVVGLRVAVAAEPWATPVVDATPTPGFDLDGLIAALVAAIIGAIIRAILAI